MMGRAKDLADFGFGFSLSEGIVQSPADIASLDVVDLDGGIELRMWLAPEKAALINERRPQIAGPTGCGPCGIDSIGQAPRPAPGVTGGPRAAPPQHLTPVAPGP